MPALTDRLPGLGTPEERPCGCRPSVSGETLVVDAGDCEADGRLARSGDCRETVIDALTDRDVECVRVESGGIERVYDDGAALLVAAGRFVERARLRDERLAERACCDPLAAAREAAGRADALSRVAEETGLSAYADTSRDYEAVLSPSVGPTVSQWRVGTTPPRGAELLATRRLDTGATVRRYGVAGPDRYHLDPVEHRLGTRALGVLDAAYERLATGAVDGGERAPARAVHRVLRADSGPGAVVPAGSEAGAGNATGADDVPAGDATLPDDGSPADANTGDAETEMPASLPVETIVGVLEKHTQGHGLLADLFADPAVSEAFVTAPAADNPLRVTADGETLRTNVRLIDAGVEGLSSRFRRESGRAFSRADPTLDATTSVAGRQVRVAGVTEPTSPSTGFAFRVKDRGVWTLPALVGNDTLTEAAAALLSVAVERGSALLTAGPRGAGKTTLLGALLWELPPAVRTVVIEDTPELPVDALQSTGRDVQALLASASRAELSPAEALHSALRLGDGALAVGEVRGEEAATLYEAMRVGANSEAVLGTIHGDGGADVYERVVSDLGVAPSSFGATDLVVTLEIAGNSRRVRLIQEVVGGEEPTFEPLFERTGAGLEPTGRIDRGNSRLLAALTKPEESYSALRERLAERGRLLAAMARRAETDGRAVTDSHARRR